VIGHPTHVRATGKDSKVVHERIIQQTIRSYNAHLSRIEVMTYKDLADTAERALTFEDEAAMLVSQMTRG
jgi:predicted component of type VI protein secretion system